MSKITLACSRLFSLWVITLLWSGCISSDSLHDRVLQLVPERSNHLSEAVLDELEARAGESLKRIAHPKTPEAADKVRSAIRAKLQESLGLDYFPEAPDLLPELVGEVRGDGYRLEKIIYQTLPGVKVPVHLYLPIISHQPAPAIVYYPGHWVEDSKSRPNFQAFCINMARLGFVVLNFDPFGQGERGVSWRDHRRTASLLIGISQQAFAVYETRCAIDYLLTRKEVDPSRIGITGASGGGYNTWMTAVLDDRITTAVPVVGTSEFLEQIHVCRSLDWYQANEHCHYVANLIRYANNHELLAAFFPKPILIIASRVDESFPIKGVREVFEYGRELYSKKGAEHRIGFFEDTKESHGYQKEKREAAYGWFLKWMAGKGDGSPFQEPPTETLPFNSEFLRCFPAGQNQPAGPGYINFIEEIADKLKKNRIPDLEHFFGAVQSGETEEVQLTEQQLQRLEFPLEENITIPTYLYKPPGFMGILIVVNDIGKEAAANDPVVLQAAKQGYAVLGIDPRGIGELKVKPMGWVAAVSLLLGENFVWKQAGDVIEVLKALSKTDSFADQRMVLYSRGDNSGQIAAYVLAWFGNRGAFSFQEFICWESFTSFEHFIRRPKSMKRSFELTASSERVQLDREIPFHYFVFNGLRMFDIPDLLESSGVMGNFIDPINGDWEPISLGEARKILPEGISAYRAEEFKSIGISAASGNQ